MFSAGNSLKLELLGYFWLASIFSFNSKTFTRTFLLFPSYLTFQSIFFK
jgi:hypothetical protein